MSGLDSSFKGWKTEYEAYLGYQECLLRGEVEWINFPGDDEGGKGAEEKKQDGGKERKGKKRGGERKQDEGRKQDDGNGDASEEYFPEDHWPI